MPERWTPVGTRDNGMTLMGRWAKYNTNRGTQWIPYPFRAPGSGKRKAFSYARPQVRGGRWKIRRFPLAYGEKPWKAWSEGKAQRWTRRFHTHAEAMAWATLVANTYRLYDDQTAITILRVYNNYPGKGQDVEFLTPDQ